jgi:site-specific DNA recombinase
MTPTHTNKRGLRYRYYVSHTIFQKRKNNVAKVIRVPAHDVEIVVTEAVRDHLGEDGQLEHSNSTDRDMVERHVERAIVKPQVIEIHIRGDADDDLHRDHERVDPSKIHSPIIVKAPWGTTSRVAPKGILHSPLPSLSINADNRDTLLTAIAKARAWIDDLTEGRAISFAEIARREGKVERHIRLLAPLAFLSPQTIAAIAEGTSSPVTVTGLAKRVSYCWNTNVEHT